MSDINKKTDIVTTASSDIVSNDNPVGPPQSVQNQETIHDSNASSGGKLSPALKKELRNVTIYVAIGTVIMFAIFLLCIIIFPEIKEHPDFEYWKIGLGGIAGGGVAVLNFLLMGLTVQKVASDENAERARSRMKLSYTYRYLMQIAWIVIAILVPCFNYIAGIVPLLFPSFGIKLASIIFKKN